MAVAPPASPAPPQVLLAHHLRQLMYGCPRIGCGHVSGLEMRPSRPRRPCDQRGRACFGI